MKVLVTGGTGFVGGHLIPTLLDNGYDVICLVRSEEKGERLTQNYDITYKVGDITKPETLIGVGENVDFAIHLAAMGHVSAVTEEAYQQFVGINEVGTQNLINELRKNPDFKKFIHFSSTAAMGPIGIPVLDEKSIPNPVTPYQKSKLRSENIVVKNIEDGFPGLILRPCMIYGVGGYGEFHKFCRLMKKGVFPKVGLGKNLTPLVHVKDVIQATMLALEKGKVGETYIVASERSLTMDELHGYIMNSLKSKAPYIYVPGSLALLGAKIIEKVFPLLGKEPIVTYANIKSTITDRTFDMKKIKADLGYAQSVTFENGIQETINWYKKQGRI